MHITYEDDITIIFINNYVTKDIDFNDIDEIKEYFKHIFLKLKDSLKLESSGYYLVKVYKDISGVIIELKEESDYYDLYNDEIEMKIILEETSFLYQIEDIFIDNYFLNNSSIIKYNNKIYLKLNNKIDDIKIGYLYEISKLMYKDTYNIIKYGKYLSFKKPLNLI